MNPRDHLGGEVAVFGDRFGVRKRFRRTWLLTTKTQRTQREARTIRNFEDRLMAASFVCFVPLWFTAFRTTPPPAHPDRRRRAHRRGRGWWHRRGYPWHGRSSRPVPATPQELVATIFHAMGIPADATIPGPDGSPVAVYPGQPVAELF